MYRSEQHLQSNFEKKDRKIKASSLERKTETSPKFKLRSDRNSKRKEEDFIKEISRLYNEESKFTRKGSFQQKSLLKGSLKNA